MNFRSDNEAPVAPEILAALLAANRGTAHAYGADAITARLAERFGALFETEVAVFPVVTGTAANALALALLAPPYGAIYCHQSAHVHADECGAPEFYTGGAKLVPLPGAHGKIAPETLAEALARADPANQHQPKPAALSLTQATEAGTVYTAPELAALAEVAHGRGLAVHMDGARFANAVAHLGCAPADLTWRAGVDVLSFGATKNGAMAAEAVVVFGPVAAGELCRRRMRGGHLLSKMRFVSAQLEASIADGLWLALASRANAGARRLAGGIGALPGVELVHPVEANELFLRLDERAIAGLAAEGVEFHRWAGTDGVIRLVVPYSASEEEIEGALALFRRHCGASFLGRAPRPGR